MPQLPVHRRRYRHHADPLDDPAPDAEWRQSRSLFYLTRQPDMTAYRDEWALPEFKDKVVVHHDFGDPDKSLDLWPSSNRRPARISTSCGPKGTDGRRARHDWTLAGIGRALRGFRCGQGRARRGRQAARPSGWGRAGADRRYRQTCRSSRGAAGERSPYSQPCESGTCGSCRMNLLAGEAGPPRPGAQRYGNG